MDERLKNIVDNFEAMKIGVDEPFPFHCTMCGKCCINSHLKATHNRMSSPSQFLKSWP